MALGGAQGEVTGELTGKGEKASALRVDGDEQRSGPGRVARRHQAEVETVTAVPQPLVELEDVGVVPERVRIRGRASRGRPAGLADGRVQYVVTGVHTVGQTG